MDREIKVIEEGKKNCYTAFAPQISLTPLAPLKVYAYNPGIASSRVESSIFVASVEND